MILLVFTIVKVKRPNVLLVFSLIFNSFKLAKDQINTLTVKVFLLYHWAILVTLRSLLPLYPRVDP